MLQSVFITGASSGIGQALAKAYLEGGARVVLLARREQPLLALQQIWGEARCRIYACSVTDAAGMNQVAEDVLQVWGLPDIVIANAGVSVGSLTTEPLDHEVFESVFSTNVFGVINTFSPFAKAMAARGSGRLVGVASIAGIRGLPGAGAYSASKAAVLVYLESVRLEMRASNVKVVTICPGYIDTPMTRLNPYPMPFLQSAQVAAKGMMNAIAVGKAFYVTPWPMRVVGWGLSVLPRWLYDRLFANAPRKPRRVAD